MSRTIEMRVLPTGQVRIHWLIFDENGPIEMPQGAVMTSVGPRLVGGSLAGCRRARLACDRKATSVLPESKRGIIKLTPNTDDPRAATCPECKASDEYKVAMAAYAETIPVG